MTALISLPLLLILAVAGGRRWVRPGRRDFRSIEEHRSTLGVIEHAAGADEDGPGGDRPDATAHVRLVAAPPRPARVRRADPEEWDDDGEPYRPPVRPSFPLPRDRSLAPPALPPPAPTRRRLVFTDGLPLTPDAPALTPDAAASRRPSRPAAPAPSLPAPSLPSRSLPGGPASSGSPARSARPADPSRSARPADPSRSARPADPSRRPGRLARRRTAGPSHPEPLLEPLAPEFGPLHMPEAMVRTLRDRAGSGPRRDAAAHRADDGVVVVSQPGADRPAAAPAPAPTTAAVPTPGPARPAAEAAPTPAFASPASTSPDSAAPAGHSEGRPPVTGTAARPARTPRPRRRPVAVAADRGSRRPVAAAADRGTRRTVVVAADRGTRRTVVALGGVAAVLVAAAGVGVARYWSGHQATAGNRTVASAGSPHPAHRAAATVTVPRAAPPAPTVTQVGTNSVEASFAVSVTPVTLSIDATSRCWVELRDVSPSGPVAYEGTLASGVSETFRAGAGLWLRLGDPNGVQVSVDGSPLSLPRTSNPFDVLVSGPTGA